MIVLFFICVVLITPVSILDNLEPLINAVSKDLGSGSSVAIMV